MRIKVTATSLEFRLLPGCAFAAEVVPASSSSERSLSEKKDTNHHED